MSAGTSVRAGPGTGRESNADLFLPYFAPYLLYVGVAAISPDWLSPAASYALRIALVVPALVWAWPRYAALSGPRSVPGSVAAGCAAGLAGTALWVALLAPFVEPSDAAWSPWAFALRVLAASLVVPVFEELCMRGYVLRFALLWEQAYREGADDPFGQAAHERTQSDVEPGAWSLLSLLVSTAVFTAGHAQAEWTAAVAYGLLMAALWIVRRDLVSCVVAHAATNASLAGYVLWSGRWELW